MTSSETWQTYQQELSSFIQRRIDNPMDAEDILQDVFYKALRNHRQLMQPDKLRGWLYQIARRTIIDYYRNHAHEQVPFEDELESLTSPFDEEPDKHSTFLECLSCLVEELPEKYRTALIASDFDAIPQHQLSRQLGLSYSGTKSRVQRGREQLRHLLETLCTGDVRQVACCSSQPSNNQCVA